MEKIHDLPQNTTDKLDRIARMDDEERLPMSEVELAARERTRTTKQESLYRIPGTTKYYLLSYDEGFGSKRLGDELDIDEVKEYTSGGIPPCWEIFMDGKGEIVHLWHQDGDTAWVDPKKVYLTEPDGSHLCYGEGPMEEPLKSAYKTTKEFGVTSYAYDVKSGEYKCYYINDATKLLHVVHGTYSKADVESFKKTLGDSFYDFTTEKGILCDPSKRTSGQQCSSNEATQGHTQASGDANICSEMGQLNEKLEWNASLVARMLNEVISRNDTSDYDAISMQ